MKLTNILDIHIWSIFEQQKYSYSHQVRRLEDFGSLTMVDGMSHRPSQTMLNGMATENGVVCSCETCDGCGKMWSSWNQDWGWASPDFSFSGSLCKNQRIPLGG